MAVFGIEADRKATVHVFMEQSNKRLQKNNLVANPFYGTIKQLPVRGTGKRVQYVIVMDPVYPRFYLSGILVILVAGMFTQFRLNWGMYAGVGILSLGFFWSRTFFYLMLSLGLKRAGYKGKVRLLNNPQVIRNMVNGIL